MHFSGGEISWPKSWFQLLSWSVTAEENKISIIVNSVKDSNKKIKLRHEDPHKGIRYLGVRQSLTGNDEQEFVFRLKEAKKLSGRIQVTPLDHGEAYTLYTERYKSTFFYPLSSTQLSEKQCKNIQSTVYQQLLPKLGYNRHMPLDVLLGPYDYGGSSLSTLYIEKHIQHIERFIRYIRRGCQTGQLFLSILDQYQLVIGTEVPILTTSVNRYPYGEHHIIQYIWEACSSINLTLDIPSV